MIDRARFFNGIRQSPFPGSLLQREVDGCNAILDEWERQKLTDLRWIAYILGTSYHETGHAMWPVKEGGSDRYLHDKPYWPWIGRGFVQITWRANYEKFRAPVKDRFGIDIIEDPDASLRLDVAAFIMIDGMVKGTFTDGRCKLSDYFNGHETDWYQARRIINGLDRTATVAAYSKQFHTDLVNAQTNSGDA